MSSPTTSHGRSPSWRELLLKWPDNTERCGHCPSAALLCASAACVPRCRICLHLRPATALPLTYSLTARGQDRLQLAFQQGRNHTGHWRYPVFRKLRAFEKAVYQRRRCLLVAPPNLYAIATLCQCTHGSAGRIPQRLRLAVWYGPSAGPTTLTTQTRRKDWHQVRCARSLRRVRIHSARGRCAPLQTRRPRNRQGCAVGRAPLDSTGTTFSGRVPTLRACSCSLSTGDGSCRLSCMPYIAGSHTSKRTPSSISTAILRRLRARRDRGCAGAVALDLHATSLTPCRWHGLKRDVVCPASMRTMLSITMQRRVEVGACTDRDRNRREIERANRCSDGAPPRSRVAAPMKHSVSVRYAQLMPAVGGSGYQRCNRRVAGNRDFEVLARDGKEPVAKRHCAARII